MSVERATPGEANWAELSAPHVARYLFASAYAAGKRVLDAGTGSGYGAALLKASGAASVLAVDIDADAIQSAAAQFATDGLQYIIDDCQKLEQAVGPFDVICNFENIEHLPHPEKFLAAAATRLSPGGALLTSTPDRASTPAFVDGKPANPFHVHEWYGPEFRKLLEATFEDIEMRVQVRSAALQSRAEAVSALRDALVWSNPLSLLAFRKFRGSGQNRPWKKLAGLAAPGIGDFPIVPAAVASVYGESWFHLAICRRPRTGNA
jgi:SAM-dependent methyltransferase